MTTEPRFLRNAAIDERVVDRASVLIDPATKRYFALNRVGSRIWALLAQPRTAAEIEQLLRAEFSVDEAECRRETGEFLRLLLRREMITRLP